MTVEETVKILVYLGVPVLLFLAFVLICYIGFLVSAKIELRKKIEAELTKKTEADVEFAMEQYSKEYIAIKALKEVKTQADCLQQQIERYYFTSETIDYSNEVIMKIINQLTIIKNTANNNNYATTTKHNQN